MMLLTFVILLLGTLLAWIGFRSGAVLCFILSMFASVSLFIHDITTKLTIQL